MRQVSDIQRELSQMRSQDFLDDAKFRRLLLEMNFHQMVLLHKVNASNGGEASWGYVEKTVTTTSERLLIIDPGSEVMLRIHNWDYSELRTVYIGQDGEVSVDQGIPLMPGEERIMMVKSDLWAVSSYAGDLIEANVSEGGKSIIRFSENAVWDAINNEWTAGATWHRAVVASSDYLTGQSLALAIAAALNAVGTATYTASYSPTTRKMTITSDGAGPVTFGIDFLASNAEAKMFIAPLIGFRPRARHGALSYVGTDAIEDNPVRLRIGRATAYNKNDGSHF